MGNLIVSKYFFIYPFFGFIKENFISFLELIYEVIGVIKNGSGEEGTPRYNEEKYKIMFTVTNNGRSRNGTFIIDPKLKPNN